MYARPSRTIARPTTEGSPLKRLRQKSLQRTNDLDRYRRSSEALPYAIGIPNVVKSLGGDEGTCRVPTPSFQLKMTLRLPDNVLEHTGPAYKIEGRRRGVTAVRPDGTDVSATPARQERFAEQELDGQREHRRVHTDPEPERERSATTSPGSGGARWRRTSCPPQVLEPIEPPKVQRLLLNDGYVPERNVSGLRGSHLAVEFKFGLQVPVK